MGTRRWQAWPASAMAGARSGAERSDVEREREASEWEGERRSAGLQMEEQASWRAARAHGGHAAPGTEVGRPLNLIQNPEGAAIPPQKCA